MKTALEDCVARKIPVLLKEGYERDQAIAVAFSECSGKSWDELGEHGQAHWLTMFAKSFTTQIKQINTDRIGGYGVVWGDEDHRDLEGEFFTPETNFFLPPVELKKGQPIKTSIPWLFDHTMSELPEHLVKNQDARDYVLGVVDTAIPDEFGLWIEAQLTRHDDWGKYVMDLVDQGMFHWSTGTTGHLAKRADNGWIKSWPLVEASSTPTPAEPRQTLNMVLKHYVKENDQRGPAGEGRSDRDGASNSESAFSPVWSNPMKMNLSTAKTVWAAYIEDIWETMKADIEAVVKQEGSNLLADALRPLSEELAAMSGQPAEDALAYLVQYVAEKVAGGAGDVEEETPMPEAMPEAMNTAIEAAVGKALAARLPAAPTGQYRTKNVGQIGRAEPPMSLGRYIWAVKNRRFDILEPMQPRIAAGYKTLGITPDTAGGYLVPVEQSNQIIELLSPGSKVFALCRQIPMMSDIMEVPKLTSGSQGAWVGENAQITGTDPAFGMIRLVAKKYATLIKISNDLLEVSDPSVDALIRQDIARDVAEALDAAILEGDGLAGKPLGLAHHPDVTKTALNAAPTVANIMGMISGVEAADVYENPAWQWVMNPRDKATLAALRDTTSGDYLWTELGLPGHTMVGGYPATLRGYPYKSTTKVTIDTANNSETRLFFGQWNDVVVGMKKTLQIVASDQAGTSFEYDQTWIRGIVKVDVNIRHADAIRILTDVRAS